MCDSISFDWMQGLSLDQRKPPDYITSPEEIEPGPYSGPIRTCLAEVGLDAVFCVDQAPSVAFLVIKEGQNISKELNRVHKALWNQGLASLLAVIQGDLLRLYSLNFRPISSSPQDAGLEDTRLLNTLSLAVDTFEISNLLSGIESGRIVYDYPDAFNDKGMIDSALLDNLHAARRQMVPMVDSNLAAQYLMQAMFLAYLRDRDIINEQYFLDASGDLQLTDLPSFFQKENIDAYKHLIAKLDGDFNGGMLSTIEDTSWKIACDALSSFLKGNLDMETGQYYIYSYDFKYIPVELISEVYDVFLGTDPKQKKATGSFYTPRFLAKLAVDQIWEYVEPNALSGGTSHVIDPACGSGIFLVALFHRYAEQFRFYNKGEQLNWDKLIEIAQALHGLDKNPTAVMLAAFSLSIALLEQVSPPQIISLKNKGKRLPLLLGHTICEGDFFDYSEDHKFSAIIGNPPWGEAKGDANSNEIWAKKTQSPCPNREMAWPFVWKAVRHLKPSGVIGFLLPITSIFFNTTSKIAVERWLRENHVIRIMNLSDMRYLLFRGSQHSSAIVVYCNKDTDINYNIEVLSPKADINLVSSRRILLATQDKKSISVEELAQAPGEIIKKLMWAESRANKLLDYLSTFQDLSTFVTPFKQASSKGKCRAYDWIFGQGFQSFTTGTRVKYQPKILNKIDKFPFIESSAINYLGLPIITGQTGRTNNQTLREGFKEGFHGPRILVREGIGCRFKAVYTEQDLVYKNAVKVISVPYAETEAGKVLTAILCSSLSSWVLMQRSQVWVSRPRFQKDDLFLIPFPRPTDMPELAKAQKAWRALVNYMDMFIDRYVTQNDAGKVLQNQKVPLNYQVILQQLDELVFDYFGLVSNERSIVSDTLKYIIPSVQPNQKNLILENHFSEKKDWDKYCSTLEAELGIWFKSVKEFPRASVVAVSKDLVIVRVSLDEDMLFYTESQNEFQGLLRSIYEHLPDRITRNVYFLRNVMVFIEDDLFIIKPRQIRFWLSEAAMSDADLIAAEMTFFSSGNKGSH